MFLWFCWKIQCWFMIAVIVLFSLQPGILEWVTCSEQCHTNVLWNNTVWNNSEQVWYMWRLLVTSHNPEQSYDWADAIILTSSLQHLTTCYDEPSCYLTNRVPRLVQSPEVAMLIRQSNAIVCRREDLLLQGNAIPSCKATALVWLKESVVL